MASDNSTLASRYFGILIFGYLLFIGLASFYLTDFISPARAARAGVNELFFLAGEFRLRWWNLRDISTNILLYMPLGFLVAMALAAAGRLQRPGFHWCWGLLLSVIVEVVQAFVGRFSDATDVLSNSCGYLLGFVIARHGVFHFAMSPAGLLGLEAGGQADRLNNLAGIRFIYVAVVLVTSLLPLDISVAMTGIYGKLQAIGDAMPRLIVDPFYHFRNGIEIRYLTLKLLVFLPLGFLSAVLQLRRGRGSLLLPACHCLLLGLIMEGANLFIRSGRSDILVPVLGFATGLAVAGAILGFASRAGPGGRVLSPPDRPYLLLSAGLLYGMLLLAIALSPYEFELSLRSIRDKLLYDSNLIPFRLHFSVRSTGSAVDLAREFLLGAPVGTILALGLRATRFDPARATLGLLACVSGLAVSGTLELLQSTVTGRYVDITDVLMATLGSLAGANTASLYLRDHPDSQPVTATRSRQQELEESRSPPQG